MLTTASDKATLCIARSVSLLIFAIVSFLSAEVTRRALQNHRYAAGLSGLAREEGGERYKVAHFLETSRNISFFAGSVQISGAVFLGVSLLAGWRTGTARSDAVFHVSRALPSHICCRIPTVLHGCARFVLPAGGARRHQMLGPYPNSNLSCEDAALEL
jgi:hypothetical protein